MTLAQLAKPIAKVRQRAFTLIELMIAMTVGLVILLALTTLFMNTSRTNREMARTNSLIENGRFAIQLIENDLVHAGFWGEHVPQFDNLTWADVPADVPAFVPDACLAWPPDPSVAEALKDALIGIPVQAYDAEPAGCSLASVRAGTDLLLVRHADTCAAGAANCEPDTAGRLYFQASLCAGQTPPYVLDTSGFDRTRRNCTALADKRLFVSNLYYVRDGAIPMLMRMRFDSGAWVGEELIDGVEALRVELGIDNVGVTGGGVDYSAEIVWDDPDTMTAPTNRGDGAPDLYRRCTTSSPCTVAELTNVVSVKLFVLARSLEPTPGYTDAKTYCVGTPNADGTCPTADRVGPFNDNFKRHVFSTTVRLNNISGRRETPS